MEKLDKIEDKAGLSERQAEELKLLHNLHNVKDSDGSPIWYVPRSWAATQREIVDKIKDYLYHRTFIGFTRERDNPPKIELSVPKFPFL